MTRSDAVGRQDHRRRMLERAIGGAAKAIRVEQFRAAGRSDRAIAREFRVDIEAVAAWFAFQDELAASDDLDGVA